MLEKFDLDESMVAGMKYPIISGHAAGLRGLLYDAPVPDGVGSRCGYLGMQTCFPNADTLVAAEDFVLPTAYQLATAEYSASLSAHAVKRGADMKRDDDIRIALNDASAAVAREKAKQFVVFFERGDCTVELYAPRGSDEQKPHDRDELYVIARGSGFFRRADERVPFAPGDVLFVKAGVDHRFESFSDDFETWVIFFGPQGGAEGNA